MCPSQIPPINFPDKDQGHLCQLRMILSVTSVNQTQWLQIREWSLIMKRGLGRGPGMGVVVVGGGLQNGREGGQEKSYPYKKGHGGMLKSNTQSFGPVLTLRLV